MEHEYETILRLLGYGVDFTAKLGPALCLGLLTWRLAK